MNCPPHPLFSVSSLPSNPSMKAHLNILLLLILNLACTGCALMESSTNSEAENEQNFVLEPGEILVPISQHGYPFPGLPTYVKVRILNEPSPQYETIPPSPPAPASDTISLPDTTYNPRQETSQKTKKPTKTRQSAPSPIPSSTPARQDDASAWQTPPVEPKDVEKL